MAPLRVRIIEVGKVSARGIDSAAGLVSGANATASPGMTPLNRRWWLFSKRVLPIVLTYLGLGLAPFCFSVSGLLVALGVLLFTCLGVTVGLHRLRTHRSFSTYRWGPRPSAHALSPS